MCNVDQINLSFVFWRFVCSFGGWLAGLDFGMAGSAILSGRC